ncbi:hypothetical protein GOP47_0022596 [Adiantum capillus-veneris]|uniref:NEDD8-activating enzyme E1 regulatory subunit n=1 Tax=Adiantum capillus-veneris TaxID=13818 RepID=A0A9D4U633_ADICA|nr:hypothetical protein GOP47_0022596 [Adiantum capillus-veneris]
MAVRNSNKYDRQLRIWGDQGQLALEQANVCLLNCGPTGAEALKNLVLGGIGSCTIVDDSKVETRDLGNNFFVDWESIGLPKAKTVCAFLQELNDTVEAKFVEESPEALLNSNPEFFFQFTLIIATQMKEQSLLALDSICRKRNVMLLIARSYGLTGLIRICVKEHCVIESKPDNAINDLRLQKPWAELKRFADELDAEIDDPVIHKHIPFAVLLIKATEDWRKTHAGSLPYTSKEKAEFKVSLASKKHGEDEDNYKEAISSAYRVWSPPTIGSELQRVLDDSAVEVNSSSPDFWVMVAALKEFISNEGEGDAPLDGTIPDMTSTTEYYVTLQKIYQEKAELHVTALEARVKNILKRIGRDPQSITKSAIKLFCKNARNIRVLRYPPLEDEFNSIIGHELQKLLEVEENSNATFYVLLRGVDHFASSYNRYPGVFDDELEEDAMKLKTLSTTLLNKMIGGGVGGAVLSDDLVSEMCRFGASEIHTVASIIGGIASQEAIKLLTRQFTPLPGVLIYNGIDSTTSVLQLKSFA